MEIPRYGPYFFRIGKKVILTGTFTPGVPLSHYGSVSCNPKLNRFIDRSVVVVVQVPVTCGLTENTDPYGPGPVPVPGNRYIPALPELNRFICSTIEIIIQIPVSGRRSEYADL